MKENGFGGSNTQSGKYFETKIYEELISFLDKKKIKYVGDFFDKDDYIKLFENELSHQKSGVILKQYQFYKFLNENEIDWKSKISKKFVPDLLIIDFLNKKISIIEIKWQKTSGSVDEKLQTAHFKFYEYKKIFDNKFFSNYKINYGYFLNDWFEKKQYKDVLEYLNNIDCFYYIDNIPWNNFISSN